MRFSTALPCLQCALNPDVPAELERIIDKCLEKDRDLRYQHASDIRTDLQRLKRDTDSGRVISQCGARRHHASPRWKIDRARRRGAAGALRRRVLLSSTARRNSPTRTRLSSPISTTRPATRCSTRRCARGWPCSLNSRRSSAWSRTSASRRRWRLMGQPADARLTPELAQRNLRANRRRRGPGRLDRQPRQPVRVGLARQELPHRRRAR